jgi:2-polyprenyl-3-methyl-5-hydroxy-6-metoxy-1,4-benzoquinol methylase
MICPNCGELKTELFFLAENRHGSGLLSDETFSVLTCSKCKLVFPRIKANSRYYSNYYPKDYYQSGVVSEGLISHSYDFLAALFSKSYLGKSILHGAVLDYGCGNGKYLANLPDRIDKYGVEINPDALTFIRNNYPNIHLYENLNQIKDKHLLFDVVTLWHVIEHLEEPKKSFKEILTHLKKDGYLIVSFPNSSSFGLKYGQSNWFHLDCPRHLQIFNYDNFIELTRELKLDVVKWKGSFFESPLDLYWSIFNRYRTDKRLLNILLGAVILPLSFCLKLSSLWAPRKAESLIFVCRKN